MLYIFTKAFWKQLYYLVHSQTRNLSFREFKEHFQHHTTLKIVNLDMPRILVIWDFCLKINTFDRNFFLSLGQFHILFFYIMVVVATTRLALPYRVSSFHWRTWNLESNYQDSNPSFFLLTLWCWAPYLIFSWLCVLSCKMGSICTHISLDCWEVLMS